MNIIHIIRTCQAQRKNRKVELGLLRKTWSHMCVKFKNAVFTLSSVLNIVTTMMTYTPKLAILEKQTCTLTSPTKPLAISTKFSEELSPYQHRNGIWFGGRSKLLCAVNWVGKLCYFSFLFVSLGFFLAAWDTVFNVMWNVHARYNLPKDPKSFCGTDSDRGWNETVWTRYRNRMWHDRWNIYTNIGPILHHTHIGPIWISLLNVSYIRGWG